MLSINSIVGRGVAAIPGIGLTGCVDGFQWVGDKENKVVLALERNFQESGGGTERQETERVLSYFDEVLWLNPKTG
jgi:hypothetical protein